MSTPMDTNFEVEVWDFSNQNKSSDYVVNKTSPTMKTIADKDTNNSMPSSGDHKIDGKDNGRNKDITTTTAAGDDCRPVVTTDSNQKYAKELRVFDRNVSQSGQQLDGFENHHKLGSFRIEDNQSYNDLNCKQNVLNCVHNLETIEKMAINLMDGFESSSLITDYKTYKALKWQYFLKWIQRSRCLVDRSSEAMPEFVAFGGLFTSLLMTPSLVEDWTLIVSKFKDTIFMNKVRLNEYSSGGQSAVDSAPSLANQRVDRNPYFAAKVTQILTKTDAKEAINESVNEFEKCFNCYETQIGGHRLLLMSEMDAIDEDGNQCEIKCSKSMAFGKKLLNWWSNCVVADIDYIIVGIKGSDDVLKEIRKVKVNEIPESDGWRRQWRTDEAFEFVNRLLDYVKDMMTDCQDLDTYRVVFRKRFKNIRSYKQTNTSLLPKWFTTDEELDEWDHQFDTQTVRV